MRLWLSAVTAALFGMLACAGAVVGNVGFAITFGAFALLHAAEAGRLVQRWWEGEG